MCCLELGSRLVLLGRGGEGASSWVGAGSVLTLLACWMGEYGVSWNSRGLVCCLVRPR